MNLPEVGHNQGPPFNPEVVATLTKQAGAISDAASAWSRAEVVNDTKAGELKDFIDTARKLQKAVEDRRKAEKQPHLDAGRAVDKAFKDITSILERSLIIARKPLEAYLRQQQEAKEAARRAAEEEARKQAEEAQRAREVAERNSSAAAQVEAERAAAEAQEAAQRAAAPARATVGSATGAGTRATGLREYRFARIDNIRHAFMHYHDHPDIADCIQRLANAEIRAAKGAPVSIPGVTVITEQKL